MILSDPNVLNILIDTDMFAYSACSASEEDVDWGNDMVSVYAHPSHYQAKFEKDLTETITRVRHFTKHKGEVNPIMVFSDKTNFRKTVLPTYKWARVTKRKPCGYPFMVKYIKEHYGSLILPKLEGDDTMAIYSTIFENTIIVSGDKDMRSIPCRLYNHLKDTYEVITAEAGWYMNLYQTLKGDTTDGYTGCPGIGDVNANKILDKDPTWAAVVATYIKKGLTEEDALVQMRVARILHESDYDVKTNEIKLWTPSIAIP